MKDKFFEYMKKIELPNTLQERVIRLHEDFSDFIPENVEEIFITDSYDNEEKRRYQNLWFITDGFVLELKSFIDSENIDLIRYTNLIDYFEITKSDFQFGNYTRKSKLRIIIKFGEANSGEFRAVDNNCEYLWNLFKSRFLSELS